MFNSAISESNTPINAIRRVLATKDGTIVSNGAMQEEGGQEPEEEEVESPPQKDGLQHERENVELSEEEEKPTTLTKQVEMKGDKDKKDKKEKEKKEKDKKKDKEVQGYNEEDKTQGKKLMSNSNFKANIERLRNQFTQQKKGTEEKPLPKKNSTADEDIPKKTHEEADKKFDLAGEDKGKPAQMAGSDIILGNKEQHPLGDAKHVPIGTFTNKGVKDLIKKPLTVTKPSEPAPAQQASESPDSKQVRFKADVKLHSKEDQVPKSQPPITEVPKSNPKVPAVREEPNQKLSAQEDWEIHDKGSSQAGPRKLTNESSGATGGAKSLSQALAINKKKKLSKDDSDNSWDEGKNPFN